MNRYVIASLISAIFIAQLYGMESEDRSLKRKARSSKVAYTRTKKPADRFRDASEYGLNFKLNKPQLLQLEQNAEMNDLAKLIQNKLPIPLAKSDIKIREYWIEQLNNCSDSKKLPLRSKLLYYKYKEFIESNPEYSLRCPLCLTYLQHLSSEKSPEVEGVLKRHPLSPSCIKKILSYTGEDSDDEIEIQNKEEQEDILTEHMTAATTDLEMLNEIQPDLFVVESLLDIRGK